MQNKKSRCTCERSWVSLQVRYLTHSHSSELVASFHPFVLCLYVAASFFMNLCPPCPLTGPFHDNSQSQWPGQHSHVWSPVYPWPFRWSPRAKSPEIRRWDQKGVWINPRSNFLLHHVRNKGRSGWCRLENRVQADFRAMCTRALRWTDHLGWRSVFP